MKKFKQGLALSLAALLGFTSGLGGGGGSFTAISISPKAAVEAPVVAAAEDAEGEIEEEVVEEVAEEATETESADLDAEVEGTEGTEEVSGEELADGEDVEAEADSEEEAEETEAEEADVEAGEELVDAESAEESEAEAVEESAEGAVEDTANEAAEEVAETTEEAEDEAGDSVENGEDLSGSDVVVEESEISENIISEDNALLNDAEVVEEEAAEAEEVSEVADELEDSNAVGPILSATSDMSKIMGVNVSELVYTSGDNAIKVENGTITGTLKYYSKDKTDNGNGAANSSDGDTELFKEWGAGWYLVLDVDAPSTIASGNVSVSVEPSIVSEYSGGTLANKSKEGVWAENLVGSKKRCIFKIYDPVNQRIEVKWNGGTHKDVYKLNLTLEPESDRDLIEVDTQRGEWIQVDGEWQQYEKKGVPYVKGIVADHREAPLTYFQDNVHVVKNGGRSTFEGVVKYVEGNAGATQDDIMGFDRPGYVLILNLSTNFEASGIKYIYAENSADSGTIEFANPDRKRGLSEIAHCEDGNAYGTYAVQLGSGKPGAIRIVGTTEEITADTQENKGGLIAYERWYSLDGLTFQNDGTDKVRNNSVTLTKCERVRGENSLIHVGDTVEYVLGGAISGNKTPDTIYVHVYDTANVFNVTGRDGTIGNNKDVDIKGFEIKNNRWTGKIELKGVLAGTAADVDLSGLYMAYGSGSSLEAVTMTAASVKLDNAITCTILPEKMNGPITATQIPSTSVKHLGIDYNKTSGASFNAFGVGEGERDETSITASIDPTKINGTDTNIVAYEWKVKEPGLTDDTYYTYVKKSSSNASWSSEFPLPNLEKTTSSGGNLTISVAAKGYYTADGDFPGDEKEGVAYPDTDVLGSKENVDSGKVVEIFKKYSDAFTVMDDGVVVDYSTLSGVNIPISEAMSNGNGYDEESSAFETGKSQGTESGRSYLVGTMTKEGDDVLSLNTEGNGLKKIVAFEWTWDKNGKDEKTYYTYAMYKDNGADEQDVSADDKLTTRSRLQVPLVNAPGSVKVGLKTKVYLWKNGGVTDSLPTGLTRFKPYTSEELETLIKAGNVTNCYAITSWGSGKITANATKDVVFEDKNSLSGFEKVKNGASEVDKVKSSPVDFTVDQKINVGDTVVWSNSSGEGGPFDLKPQGIGDVVYSVGTITNPEVVEASINENTGVVTVKGLKDGKATIEFKATKGEKSLSCSIGVEVAPKNLAAEWDTTGGRSATIWTHEGATSVGLLNILQNPDNEDISDKNLLKVTIGTHEATAAELRKFGYTFDYPSDRAEKTAAESMYTIGTDKKTIALKEGANGSAKIVVNVECGDYGTVQVAETTISVEKAIPSTLTVDSFNPASLTVNNKDRGERIVEVNLGGVDLSSKITVNWSVDAQETGYVGAEALSDSEKNKAKIKLKDGADGRYSSDTTVPITVYATQTFNDGTKVETNRAKYYVNVTTKTVTLNGMRITDSSSGKVVNKASTNSTDTVDSKAVIVQKDGTRTVQAVALPTGVEVKSDWRWESKDPAVATVASTGTKQALATIKGVKYGTTTITATCGDDSSFKQSFDVQVYEKPGTPVMTIAGASRAADSTFVATLNESYKVDYTISADGDTTTVRGYQLEVGAADTTQTIDKVETEILSVGSAVTTTGQGTITAKAFTANPATFNYKFVLKDEYGNQLGNAVDGGYVKVVVDNQALSGSNPVSFKPSAAQVAPQGTVEVAYTLNPVNATNVQTTWSLVDYSTNHSDPSKDTALDVAKYAMIDGNTNGASVKVRGIANGTNKVQLRLEYKQDYLDASYKKQTNTKYEYVPLTISGSTIDVETLNVYVDGVLDNQTTSASNYRLNNVAGKDMKFTSSILPSNVENKGVDWEISGTVATIKEAAGQTKYTGTSVTIEPVVGTTGNATLTAKPSAGNSSISKVFNISVGSFALSGVEFAVEESGTYTIITDESIGRTSTVKVVALPVPRSAAYDAAKTTFAVYGKATGTDAANDYIRWTDNKDSTISITGNAAGINATDKDYISATMTDGTVTVTSAARLGIHVTSSSPAFTSVVLDTAEGNIKKGGKLVVNASFAPIGADPMTLRWNVTGGTAVTAGRSVESPVVKVDVSSDGKSATITGLKEGTDNVSVEGTAATGVAGSAVKASVAISVSEDKPNGVTVGNIAVKGQTADLTIADAAAKDVYAIVPASQTVVVSAKATKDGADASNTGVRWYDAQGTEMTGSTADGTTSIEVASGAADTVTTITARAAADSQFRKTITIYSAPILSTASASAKEFTVEKIDDQQYTGSAINPAVSVKFRNYTLSAADFKADYDAQGADFVSVGKKTVGISAVSGGKFTAATANPLSAEFEVVAADLSKAELTFASDKLSYNGETQRPVLSSVKVNGVELKPEWLSMYAGEGKDAGKYTAKYQMNPDYVGAKNYDGTVSGEYEIAALDFANGEFAIADQTYTGKALTPALSSAKVGSFELSAADYEVSYKDNTNAGTATATVKAKGTNFTGSKDVSFKINGIALTAKHVSLANDKFTYNGKKQAPTVKYTAPVVANDVTVTTPASTNAGSYKVVVSAKAGGNYTGSVDLPYTIAKANVSGMTPTLAKTAYTYTGNVQKPAVSSITGAIGNMKANTDYTIVYSNVNSKNVGSYTVKITGKGTNFQGTSKTATYKINQANGKLVLKASKATIYGAKTAQISAKTNLSKGKLTYKSLNAKVATVNASGKVTGVKAGTAKITVTSAAKGGYKKATATYTVTVKKPAKPNIQNPATASKSVTAKWKKVSNATGYYVQIATDKNFKKNLKSATIKKNGTVSYKFTKLKKGTTYYVRVYSYAGKNNANCRSAASAVKKIKCK